MKNNQGLIVLLTLLIQSLIIVTINHCILSAQELAYLKTLLPWVNLIVVIIFVLTMLSIKQLEEDVENRTKIKLLRKHVLEIESLNMLLRSQKHEYAKHFQYLQSLAYLRRYDELMEYINALAKDYRHTEILINTGHPSITTLINTKRNTAEAQGIEFAVAVKSDLSKLTVPPWDLNSILGNLIENAMEAAMEDKHPQVAIEFSRQKGQYVFYIANNGTTILDKNRIYEPGYTTKDSSSRGYGLFLVKQVVDQYGGDIEISCGKKTHFTVRLPDGGSGDDKFYLPDDSRSFGQKVGSR